MRKLILFTTPLLILTILFLLIVLVINRDAGKGALQVTSVPESQVFLDGNYVGKTPLCLCELKDLLKVGEYTIKLVPVDKGLKNFEQKITLYKGVLTVVDRTYDKDVSASSGTIITLSPIDDENIAELMVTSFPSNARVILDSNPVGETPYLINLTASDHEIKLLKDGYKEKVIKVKGVLGKRLEVTMSLGIKLDAKEVEQRASVSAVTTPQVTILETPTGELNVRAENSVGSELIGTLLPGDKVDLISEETGWYEVRLKDGKTGWVSATYASKN